jgi:hypothetical protein
MNCPECQELLQRRLDGERIATSESLDRHLSECAACREQHTAALRLLDGIKHLPQAKAPTGFANSIVAAVMQDRRQRQDKMRRRIVVTMALAASVLLMLAAGYYWLPRPTDQAHASKQEMVENKPPQPVPTPKGPVVPKKIDGPEPQHALSALQDRLANTTRDHAKVVLAAANLDGMEMPTVNDEPADPSVQEISDGMRSVTRTARKAFDFFARELPMPNVGEPKD